MLIIALLFLVLRRLFFALCRLCRDHTLQLILGLEHLLHRSHQIDIYRWLCDWRHRLTCMQQRLLRRKFFIKLYIWSIRLICPVFTWQHALRRKGFVLFCHAPSKKKIFSLPRLGLKQPDRSFDSDILYGVSKPI